MVSLFKKRRNEGTKSTKQVSLTRDEPTEKSRPEPSLDLRLWFDVALRHNATLKPVLGLYRTRCVGREIWVMSHLWSLMDFSLARLPQLSGEKAGADTVIYLHFSTSCNGWHIHLSLKLHLTAAAHLAPRGVKEKWYWHAAHTQKKTTQKWKETNWRVTSPLHLLIKAVRATHLARWNC